MIEVRKVSNLLQHNVKSISCINRVVLKRVIKEFGGNKVFLSECNLLQDKEAFRTKLKSIATKLVSKSKGRFKTFFEYDIETETTYYKRHLITYKALVRGFELI